MAAAGKDQKRKMPFSVWFAVFMTLVTLAIFLPTTILVSVCMIPTLVAAIVDNHPHKTAWLTVGAMNLAGTIPVWFTLWEMGHTIPMAFQLVVQPSSIMISYGASCVGWILYYNVTPFVASMIVNKNERRLKAIDKRQKDLIRKWGDGVASDE